MDDGGPLSSLIAASIFMSWPSPRRARHPHVNQGAAGKKLVLNFTPLPAWHPAAMMGSVAMVTEGSCALPASRGRGLTDGSRHPLLPYHYTTQAGEIFITGRLREPRKIKEPLTKQRQGPSPSFPRVLNVR